VRVPSACGTGDWYAGLGLAKGSAKIEKNADIRHTEHNPQCVMKSLDTNSTRFLMQSFSGMLPFLTHLTVAPKTRVLPLETKRVIGAGGRMVKNGISLGAKNRKVIHTAGLF
jgi:hypothetical protein